MTKLANRLRRAQGQIGGVLRMIEEGRECQDIVMQLAAVRRAVDRAGFSIIATGLKQCVTEAHERGDEEIDTALMEKLFISLA
ncbi:MAG: metal-sensitive transcriptional regulator [Dermatophilaceae bacterium]|nr:metal-sensitive transcriptional regulator [Actinomycetales bacterium]MBP8880450.1 metal-sensitive transcriptional regulator [Dermatophilaceae bacterium]MBP9919196.1 metal-sensitive transcriptional regulator [Dermatophilaceae bacterium]